MPAKLDRCVKEVMKQGKSEDSAWAICQASMKKSGKNETTKALPEGVNKEKFERCVMAVKKQGDVDNPYAVCMAALTGQTEKGVEEALKAIEHRGVTFPGYNKPRKSNRPGKKKMVLAKKGDKTKVIHYGDTQYKHNYSAEAKRNFRARHRCDQQNDKLSAAYWACKDLWPTGSTKKSTLVYKAERMKDDPCWEGYEMVGHKMKDGKKVPNCVPKGKDTKKGMNDLATEFLIPSYRAVEDENRDVFVAISVPSHVASKLYLHDGEDPNNFKIVLAYVAPDSDVASLRRIVSEFAKTILEPIELKTTGMGRFVEDCIDVNDVLYVSVDSPVLSFERERLVAMLEENGIIVDKHHGFNPHIRVKYMDKTEPTPEFSEAGVCTWTASHIEIWQGSFRYKYGTIYHPISQGVIS